MFLHQIKFNRPGVTVKNGHKFLIKLKCLIALLCFIGYKKKRGMFEVIQVAIRE